MSDCKVTAICNQKGGVTKTTTTANLGIGLAMQGKKVLLVDIDPQADLTASLGWPNSDALPMTLADILEKTLHDVGKGYGQGVAVRPAQRGSQVSLGVNIHKQNLFALHGKPDAEIGRCGGLGYAAFLVTNRRDFAIRHTGFLLP